MSQRGVNLSWPAINEKREMKMGAVARVTAPWAAPIRAMPSIHRTMYTPLERNPDRRSRGHSRRGADSLSPMAIKRMKKNGNCRRQRAAIMLGGVQWSEYPSLTTLKLSAQARTTNTSSFGPKDWR